MNREVGLSSILGLGRQFGIKGGIVYIFQFIRIFINSTTRVMTTKLTLTIDDSVIATAKEFAKNNGKSLSQIVENYLVTLTAPDKMQEEISPRILKLMGAIELPEDFEYKKSFTEALSKKYKL